MLEGGRGHSPCLISWFYYYATTPTVIHTAGFATSSDQSLNTRGAPKVHYARLKLLIQGKKFQSRRLQKPRQWDRPHLRFSCRNSSDVCEIALSLSLSPSLFYTDRLCPCSPFRIFTLRPFSLSAFTLYLLFLSLASMASVPTKGICSYCQSESTQLRNGWQFRSGEFAKLCEPCG